MTADEHEPIGRMHPCTICGAVTWHDPNDGECIRCHHAFPEFAARRRRDAPPRIDPRRRRAVGQWAELSQPREDD